MLLEETCLWLVAFRYDFHRILLMVELLKHAGTSALLSCTTAVWQINLNLLWGAILKTGQTNALGWVVATFATRKLSHSNLRVVWLVCAFHMAKLVVSICRSVLHTTLQACEYGWFAVRLLVTWFRSFVLTKDRLLTTLSPDVNSLADKLLGTWHMTKWWALSEEGLTVWWLLDHSPTYDTLITKIVICNGKWVGSIRIETACIVDSSVTLYSVDTDCLAQVLLGMQKIACLWLWVNMCVLLSVT